MNSSNTKLKPLDHKKPPNSNPLTQVQPQPQKQPLSKKATQPTVSSGMVKKQAEQQNPAFKSIKYNRSSNRAQTKIQLYECNDFDMPALEDDGYFQQQLQKNSKVENSNNNTSLGGLNPGKGQKMVPKNQVVLPKLQGDQSIRNMKDIEKQMDAEMSKMLDRQMNQDY